jgi:methionyl-tRNA formyltransferase
MRKDVSNMKIICWTNGNRGERCLFSIYNAGFNIDALIVHPEAESKWSSEIQPQAKEFGIECRAFEDPNSEKSQAQLSTRNADLFVLADYRKILKSHIFNLPKLKSINLHGGKLPQYRGSSPLNLSSKLFMEEFA